MTRLDRFIKWGEKILRDGENGDWTALRWFAFANLTAASFVVMIVVAVLLLLGH